MIFWENSFESFRMFIVRLKCQVIDFKLIGLECITLSDPM